MKNILYLFVGVLGLVAVAIIFLVMQNMAPVEEPEETGAGVVQEQIIQEDEKDEGTMDSGESASVPVVRYTGDGYVPSTITIGAGDAVTFRNESSRGMWTASAVHPVHTVYPGSGINKCGTSEQGSIFDACTGIGGGGEWQFQFNEIGEWRFHNHLRPSHTGTVIVQ